MNYHKKEDLMFEVLKGVNMHDKLECEHEEACVKSMLTNVEINNRKYSKEQRNYNGKMKKIVTMRRGMISCGREWKKQNYGGKWKAKMIGDRQIKAA